MQFALELTPPLASYHPTVPFSSFSQELRWNLHFVPIETLDCTSTNSGCGSTALSNCSTAISTFLYSKNHVLVE